MAKNSKKKFKTKFLLTCSTEAFVRHMSGKPYSKEDFKEIAKIKESFDAK